VDDEWLHSEYSIFFAKTLEKNAKTANFFKNLQFTHKKLHFTLVFCR